MAKKKPSNRDRARKRVIRARMAQTGEPFTVAARRHDEGVLRRSIDRYVRLAAAQSNWPSHIVVHLGRRLVDQQLAALNPGRMLSQQINSQVAEIIKHVGAPRL